MEIFQAVKFNLASAIELSKAVNFVYNFLHKQLWWHILPTFLLMFFMRFSQKKPLYFFYTMVQKSKWPKTQIKRGSCLARHLLTLRYYAPPFACAILPLVVLLSVDRVFSPFSSCQVYINTNICDPHDYLQHLLSITNMRCLTPAKALVGQSTFLAANLYARSIFGEDALANVSVERTNPDSPVTGHIRIRTRTQGMALSLGDKVTLSQKKAVNSGS